MSQGPSSAASVAKVEPYISASQRLPELTLGVVILGCLLSVILAGANAYLGMFAGMTVSASVPAAVISMAIFKLLRRGNILQNNAVQTAAASGEGLAAGVIFTLPALVMLHVWARFSYIETTLIAGFGGILGVLFTIPLRRALIIDQPLQFPEGVATAEVLKAGAEGGGGVGVLVVAGVIGAVVKVGATGLKLWAEIVQFAGWATGGASTASATKTGAAISKGGAPFYFGINASPALLSVGYIVGFSVAAVIFAGAVLNRWIAMPLFAIYGDPSTIITSDVTVPIFHYINGSWGIDDLLVRHNYLSEALVGADAMKAATLYHKFVTRYLGVGGMLVGGLFSLYRLRKSLLGGVTAGLDAYKKRKSGTADAIVRTEHDMPMNFILIAIAVSVIPLFFIFNHFTDSIGISAVMAVVMVIAGFLFSAVASYMAGLVGSSNNPVSGITISTILVSALLLLGMGLKSPAGPVAAILIGGVVCCAAAIGGDNLQDLKCGQLVGSTPWKQQVMQILGVVVAAFAMSPILNLLNDAYHIGSDALPAPQAGLMGTVAKGVFEGGLPKTIIGIGALIAAVVIAIDIALEKRNAKFRIPVMAFAVGIYLPFDLNVPIFLGGVIAMLVNRTLDKTAASPERRGVVERMGLLAAAGFITGEALMGIGLAAPVAIKHDENAIALFLDSNGCDPQHPMCHAAYGEFMIPSLIFVGIVMFLLYKLALRPESAQRETGPTE